MLRSIGLWINRSKTAGYAGYSVERITAAMGHNLPADSKNHFMDEILKYKSFIDECYQSYEGSDKEPLLMAGAIRGCTAILFAAQYVPKDDTHGRNTITLAKSYIMTIDELNDEQAIDPFPKQYLELAVQAVTIVVALDY